MGRCQGFYCTAEVVERFARHTGARHTRSWGWRRDGGSVAEGRRWTPSSSAAGRPGWRPQPRSPGPVRAVVVDREAELGGIPRHTDHLGYGMREFHRLLRGPAYARPGWPGPSAPVSTSARRPR